MSTEIATTAREHVALAPIQAGAVPDPIDNLIRYSQAIEVAYEFADKLCRTSLVPGIYRGKPADGAVAILYGAELGLNPIQALQQVFTVHGTPAIYARTMVALLKTKGYMFKTAASSDESVTVTGLSPDGETETSTWTIDRAVKAGYVPTIDERTGKYKTNANGKLIGNEKYFTDPQAMLYAKAAAEVCRKLAPDVLLGISQTREDLESEPAPNIEEPTPVRVRSERMSAADILDEAGPRAEAEHNGAATPFGSYVPAGGAGGAPGKPDASHASQVTVTTPAPAAPEQQAPEENPAAPDAEAAREPAPTDQQIKDLKAALVAEGLKTARQQVEYLRKQFGRPVGALFDLTGREASELTHFLMTAPKAAAASSEQLAVDGNGGE